MNAREIVKALGGGGGGWTIPRQHQQARLENAVEGRVVNDGIGMSHSIDRDGVSYGFALALDGSGGHEDGVSTPG